MSNTSLKVLGILSASVLIEAGCGARDPVASLRSEVNDAAARLESKPAIITEPKSRLADEKPFFRWVYKVEQDGIKVDVVKTESLVTPYKGTVHFPVRQVFSDFATRKDAEAFTKSFDMSDVSVVEWVLQYDFTEGKWKFVDAQDTSYGGRPLMREELERLRN